MKFKSLGSKVFGASAVIILLAVGAVGLLGYRQSKRAIVAEAKRHVYGVALERKARLNEWFASQLQGMRIRSADHHIQNRLSKVKSKDTCPDEFCDFQLVRMLQSWVADDRRLSFAGIVDLDGHLLEHAGPLPGELSIKIMPSVEKALKGEDGIGPVHLSPEGKSLINLSSPIENSEGEILGAMLSTILIEQSIQPLLADTIGLGTSGEVYLVGRDTLMLTRSRFMNHPGPLTHKMPTPTILSALSGGQGVEVYKGFLGNEVVGAYLYIPEQHWALIAEMKTDEAFKPLRMIGITTFLAALASLVVMVGVTMALSRTWTVPLSQLAEASLRVGKGNFDEIVPEPPRQDEIGTVVHEFNHMVQSLRISREELQRSQKRLIQAEKLAAIGGLTAGIVHEMRNPLSSIKMNLRILERNPPADPLMREHISLATGEIARLERMLSELLDYSKPPSLQLEELLVRDLVVQALETIRSQAEDAGVTIASEVHTERIPSRIIADREQLVRALSNLLLNAVQASSRGTQVRLVVDADDEQPERRILFSVEDHGRGINPRHLQRLFDPFFTTRSDGVGLGMSNVKKIIEAHEGRIWIKSEEKKGTTVRVSFPIDAEQIHNGQAVDN